METPNSMTYEELEDNLESIFKALILKYVKLDFLAMGDPKTEDIYTSCPIFSMGTDIYGAPYIVVSNGKKFYITYKTMRRYELKNSELIYHARQNTLKVINRLFKCDGETEKPMNVELAVMSTDDATFVDLNKLNEALKKGEING